MFKIITGDVRYVEKKLNEYPDALIAAYQMKDNMLVRCVIVYDSNSNS